MKVLIFVNYQGNQYEWDNLTEQEKKKMTEKLNQVEVPTGNQKITFQIHFIPKMQNSQKAKKSKLEDIAWDLHLVKDVVIAVLIGIIVSHMNGIETIAAVFTGMLMLIALVHIDCEIHMTVGRKR